MNNQLVNKFCEDIKNVLTKEKLRDYLKLPVYSYIISFIFSIIIVLILPYLMPNLPKDNLTFEKLGLSTSKTWLYVITNNMKVLIVLFASGIILYIGPILVIGINGFLHGLLLFASIQGAGLKGLATYLILMVPHGIFELPALFFGAGAGILLSKELVNLLILRWVNKDRLYEAFLLLFISLCLFLIASVVETQITFKILKAL